MNLKSTHMLAGALALGLSGVAFGAESAPATSAELQALRAEVAQLRASQGENWLTERRAEEVKTLVREVLADADTRASLLQEGLTAGYNGQNFFLSSSDGAFSLNVGGQIQVRYIANFNDENTSGNGAGDDEDDNEAGFSIARAKINFFGHVGDPRIGYQVRLAQLPSTRFDDDDDASLSTIGAEVVKVDYKINDKWTIAAGRFKAPFLREELVSSAKQLTVERSLVNEVFTVGYTEGVSLTWEASDRFIVTGMVNDGIRAGELANQSGLPGGNDPGDFGTDFDRDSTDFAVTARVDYRLLGDWDQMDDFSAWSGEETSVVLGAAVHYEKSETHDENEVKLDDVLLWTIDASLEHNSWGLYGAVVYNRVDYDRGYTSRGADENWGALIQGSYNYNDKIEPFVRYEYIHTDGRWGDTMELVTVGANYYLRGHNAKFTLDLVWAISDLDLDNDDNQTFLNADSLPLLGLLNEDRDADNQVALRAQFQLLF